MGSKFHTSRLYVSTATKMPTPEDVIRQQYPFADTWNCREGRRGTARVDIDWYDGHAVTFFNVIDSCGGVTHWRWSKSGGK